MEDEKKQQIAAKKITPLSEVEKMANTKQLLNLSREENLTRQKLLELLAAGADVNGVDKNGKTVLHYAVKYKDRAKAIVECLIQNKADLNVADNFARTALHYAIISNNIGIIKLLIANNAEVNTTDKFGTTPLYLAFTLKNEAIVECLVENKADLNAVDASGRTALHHALKYAGKAIVELLLANQAGINVADTKGKTALHYAAMLTLNNKLRATEVAALLIENRVDVNRVDNEGKTALHYAVIFMNEAVVKLLIENKVTLNIADEQGKTALHHVAIHRNTKIAELLIKNKADVNATDKQGRTVLHDTFLFRRGNHPEISKLLIRIILLENPQAEKPNYLNNEPSLSEFWDVCCAQINAMQKESISAYRLSVYEFYITEMSDLVTLLSKWTLDIFKEKLDTPNFVQNFSLFFDQLKDKLAQLTSLKKERDNLLRLAKKCKISSKDNSINLNEDTLLKVFDYLPMSDIKNFLSAALPTMKPTETISVTDSSATAPRLG
jgi:ankyrin repeat protein